MPFDRKIYSVLYLVHIYPIKLLTYSVLLALVNSNMDLQSPYVVRTRFAFCIFQETDIKAFKRQADRKAERSKNWLDNGVLTGYDDVRGENGTSETMGLGRREKLYVFFSETLWDIELPLNWCNAPKTCHSSWRLWQVHWYCHCAFSIQRPIKKIEFLALCITWSLIS